MNWRDIMNMVGAMSTLTLSSADHRLQLALNDQGETLRFFERAEDREIDYFARPAGNKNPLMHPWCNRVEAGVFDFNGARHLLRPLHGAENNALHGNWLQPWRVTRVDGGTAQLDIDCPARSGETPYDYTARQVLRLGDDGLQVEMSLTNRGITLPFGMGLHPFLARDAETIVTMRPTAMENCRADMIPDAALPVVPVPWNFAEGLNISRANLSPARYGFNFADLMDCSFLGVDPLDGALIDWPLKKRRMRMTASANCRYAVIYVPAAFDDFFCLEFTTNGINMPNRSDAGGVVLQRGETLEVTTTFAIETSL